MLFEMVWTIQMGEAHQTPQAQKNDFSHSNSEARNGAALNED